MSATSASRARAGLLACLCGAYRRPEEGAEERGPASPVLLCAGFGLAVLSQAMTLSVLPVAGALFAPSAPLSPWPFAALLTGAGLATFPASLLRDGFGRRAAFALGASLGVAGGALAAWSTVAMSFPALVLGSLWLGCAQGFGLFYRHETAASPHGAAGLATVFSGGVLASVLAPWLMRAAAAAAGPNLFAAALLAAALAHVATLALALALPPRFEPPPRGTEGRGGVAGVALATACAATAWFAMARLMVDAPSSLVACGVGASGIAALVSWHLLAMYLPGLFAGQICDVLGPRTTTLIGTAMALVAAALPLSGAADGGALMVMGGVGWGLATASATLMLARRPTSRVGLAVHDGSLFLAALAGALLRA
jgi:hypothetical protein